MLNPIKIQKSYIISPVFIGGMCNLNYIPQSDLRENFWVDNQLVVCSEDKFIWKSNQIFAEKQTRRRVSTHRFHRNLSCAARAYTTYWSSWFNRLVNKTTRSSVTSQTNERAEFWLIWSYWPWHGSFPWWPASSCQAGLKDTCAITVLTTT